MYDTSFFERKFDVIFIECAETRKFRGGKTSKRQTLIVVYIG